MKIIFWICFSLWIVGCDFKMPGTNTGNPEYSDTPNMSPALDSTAAVLAYEVCKKISACYAQASLNTCYSQVFSLNGYTSELGATGSTYPTMALLSAGETVYSIQVNATNAVACTDAISQLTCADVLVTNGYAAGNSTDYAQTKLLFQASGLCAQIY